MILAFHSIISNYGIWLPNEPRGSWSEVVRKWELYLWGVATTVTTRRSLAKRSYDRQKKSYLVDEPAFDPVIFTGAQARLVGMSLQRVPYPIYALAVMKNHTHIVHGRTDRDVRRAVGHMKAEATRLLRRHGHFIDHSPWADHGWNVYLDSVQDVERAIAYTNDNPMRDGMRKQVWQCVMPFVSQ